MEQEIQSLDLGLLAKVQQEPPHWASDVIKAWDEERYRQLEAFVTQDYWTDQGSVNVFRVVGTQHRDYQGKTWLEFLETGKRMDLNLELYRKKPGYYQETGRKKPMMYYLTMDGLSYYVGADGNHRTCIARFDYHYREQTVLHGVSINHMHVDVEFYQLYQQLKTVIKERKILVNLEVRRSHKGREDTPGWKLDSYQPQIVYEDVETLNTELLDKSDIAEKIRMLSMPARRRWFGLVNPG